MSKRVSFGVVAAAMLLVGPPAASARPIEDWPYDRLFKAADLVVLATAVKTTVADDKSPEHSWAYEFVAQTTTLKVKHPLKGKADGEHIKVLHFKFGELKKGRGAGTEGVVIQNGPILVEFRTEGVIATVGERRHVLPAPEYLLFLKRLPDGRYEPVSGRIDPGLSVKEVAGPPADEKLGGEAAGEPGLGGFDLVTANRLHRHFEDTCIWPGVAVQYSGALARTAPGKTFIKTIREGTFLEWTVCTSNDDRQLIKSLFTFRVRLTDAGDTVAKLKLGDTTLYASLVNEAHDEPPATTKRRLDEKVFRASDELEPLGLTPRKMIEQLFSDGKKSRDR